MVAKSISCFVVVDAVLVIVKNPCRVLAATRLMNQIAVLLVFTVPKPADSALFAMAFPKFGIDMPLGIQRRHQNVAMLR